jgi:TPR repeat protein
LDQTKCLELLREAVDLGSPSACYELGNYYATGAMGLEQNVDEGFKYWEKAAEGGHLLSRHNLALRDGRNGDPVAVVRHVRLAASGGFKMSMVNLIEGFESGFIQHAVLAETLQAFYLARAEMKSEDRDQYIQHLKMTGKYEAAFES